MYVSHILSELNGNQVISISLEGRRAQQWKRSEKWKCSKRRRLPTFCGVLEAIKKFFKASHQVRSESSTEEETPLTQGCAERRKGLEQPCIFFLRGPFFMKDAARSPKFRRDLVVSEQAGREGRLYILKDPRTERFFRLRAVEYEIAQQFDGHVSINTWPPRIKPEMTGYAKIYCGKRSLASLLSRRLLRFLRTEFWSWF